MSKFRKKSVVIDAFRWTGGPDQTEDPEWIVEAIREGDVRVVGSGSPAVQLHIEHMGTVIANPGDWIIRGVEGEIYPCKPEIFEATYEAVEP